MGKPNDVAQFVHDHSANQKGAVRPLHDLFKSWGVQCHLPSNQGRGTPGGRGRARSHQLRQLCLPDVDFPQEWTTQSGPAPTDVP